MKTIIEKVFAVFNLDYGNKWTSSRTSDIWEMTVERWAEMLSRFSETILLTSAKRSILIHKDFPPTLGQFIDICKLVERENKPIELPNYTVNSIEDLTKQKTESTVALDEMAKIKKILQGKGSELAKPIALPDWEPELITPFSKKYNPRVAAERRMFLLNISEGESLGLSLNDRYDRLRFIAEKETWHNEQAYTDDKTKKKSQTYAKRPSRNAETVTDYTYKQAKGFNRVYIDDEGVMV